MTDFKFTDDEEARRAEEAAALAKEVISDFLRRQQERRAIERGWRLNMNFLSGNQYCDVNRLGEIENEDKDYFWRERRVFNYIAPTVDTRLAKLSRIRPKLAVRAASEDEKDLHSAKISSAILSAALDDCEIDCEISAATVWSETCGTAFYKVVWDGAAGKEIAKNGASSVHEGGVGVKAVSPFEIYPFALSEEKLENQPSIIHARALPVDDIYAAYGLKLAGKDIDEFSLSPYSSASHTPATGEARAVKHGYELVIERYERPTADRPNGRLTIVAGDSLVHDGDLPYINRGDGRRGYPFVKQNCVNQAGSFFGACMVDRLIPVQRAYNAVKNRKHEFLNRITMGTIAVEDGSVDTDELLEDGFAPGKIIIYRQGGTPPEMLTLGSVPAEFSDEEEKLLEEFRKISGTSEFTQNANGFNSVTSATGLQLIIEQDEARLNVSYEQIKNALKEIGRQVLRLYRQFATDLHLMRYAGDNDVLSLFYFKGADITSDDVVLEADSEINLSPAQRRAVVYDMLDKGLLSDDDGKVSRTVKNKILNALGYKGFVGGRDIAELHRVRCGEENLALKEGACEVKSYDDHALHITEHTAFLLTEKLDEGQEKRFTAHIKEHEKLLKDRISEEKEDENNG